MEINKDFWQGKRVFLTGHTGFKGSWMSIWLKMLGAEVTGFALPPATNPDMFTVVQNDREINSIIGDIRDLSLIQRTIKQYKPDIVMHMAAQAIVRQSYREPIDTFQTNIMGTANILEAVRDTDTVKAVLCITSDKCYENREWVWKYRESDPVGGWDPYSASKGCSELVIASYKNSYFNDDLYDSQGVAVASARAGNVVGGGDWGHDRLIPDMIKSFSDGKRVIIRSPNAVRPWQHVIDLLRGYIMLTEKLYQYGPQYAEAWNFGPIDNDEKTVQEIVNKVSALWGNGASWELDKNFNPHEALSLKLDSSKARARLGWSSALDIETTLEYVVQWYKAHHKGEDMFHITSQQIQEVEDRYAKSNNPNMKITHNQ